MIRLGRPIKVLKPDETDKDCVVSSHMGMQTCLAGKVKISPKMVRDPESVTWSNKTVTLLKFESPKNNFYNTPASRVMGRTVRGNCILLSPDGISATEVKTWIEQNRVEPTSWANMAHMLPKNIPLDEESKERRRQEELEREREWERHKEMKRRARQPHLYKEDEESDGDDFCDGLTEGDFNC